MLEFLLGFGILFYIFAFILAIVWILLPFAVFGIKSKLDKVVILLTKLTKQIELAATNKTKNSIDPKTFITSCYKCLYYNKINDKCTKTGYNIKKFKLKEYLIKKMNPCEGRYFKEI